VCRQIKRRKWRFGGHGKRDKRIDILKSRAKIGRHSHIGVEGIFDGMSLFMDNFIVVAPKFLFILGWRTCRRGENGKGLRYLGDRQSFLSSVIGCFKAPFYAFASLCNFDGIVDVEVGKDVFNVI
jgi:hypothetical protein